MTNEELEELFKPTGPDRVEYELRKMEERKLLDEQQVILDHLVHNETALTKPEKVKWTAYLKSAVLRYIAAVNCAAIRRYAEPGTWQAEAQPENILIGNDNDRWDFELAVPCGHSSICRFNITDRPDIAIATVLDDKTRRLQATFICDLIPHA